MSWMRENGGYANGASNGYGRSYDPENSSRDTSVDNRSRSRAPGGYGGLGTDGPGSRSGGGSFLDRRQANRRSEDRGWDSSRSRSRVTGRGSENTRNVEDILRYIEQHWSFMSSDSCTPIKVALQLMDESSLGLADQQDGFRRTHQQLQSALKAIVNEHHQGFNSSIGTFHQIQSSLQLSQQRVRDLKSSLVGAKVNLSVNRPELKAFASSSQNYDNMLQALSHMEDLQLMPERIETQISEKHFLGAVDTLQEALKLVRRPELEEIGALGDLQVYLGNQEHSLGDILIEELHSHLYLKSPYCEARWRRYATADKQGTERADTNRERKQLFDFLDSLDLTKALNEDPARNPEANSFNYILILLEALGRMSRLDVAVDAIEQRMPVELFRVVEKCYIEVEQRHPLNARSSDSRRADVADVWQDHTSREDIIEDMLSSLYARFEAIAEGHRVMHDVISGISKRHGQRDSTLLRSFNELWKLYQSEIRSLLHDHLSSSGDLNSRSKSGSNAKTNIFRPHIRDKNKRLFRLVDTDTSSTAISTEREDLDAIFKASVPGLVTHGLSSGERVDDVGKPADRSATGHKLLVEPSVFNMSILLPPSLAFLTRLRDIVPSHSDVVVSTLTSFLDDFLVNVFEPQMEETLTAACDLAYGQSDAFQEDPRWQAYGSRPIFKSSIDLYRLIESFCRMLSSLPPNQAFSELILNQVRTHYNRLNDIYRTIVTRVSADPSVSKARHKSASLAEGGDLLPIIKNIVNSPSSATSDLYDIETAALIQMLLATPLHSEELITSSKSIRQMAVLFTSSLWFTTRLQSLRHVDAKPSNPHTSIAAYQLRAWTDSSANSAPHLPLSTETAVEFDSLSTAFSDLSALTLRALHLEYRLQTLTGISKAMSSTYALGQPYNEPDPAILTLTKTVRSFDAELVTHLPRENYTACTAGLAGAVDTALVRFAPGIKAMDAFGAKRMALNILVLQQGLKEVNAQAELEGSARHWGMWERGAGKALKEYRAGKIGTDEAKQLVRLGFMDGEEARRDLVLEKIV